MGERSKLTEAQRRYLALANEETFGDYSGRGAYVWNRRELAVYERLSSRGLVTIGHIHVRITPAGRSALRQEGE